ncbi:AAA family ATPase [Campylobacter concisus]|uniref:AAA family ATPase n=1 Tax=Campylobacter concisus TaxID=199 RepID=UPI001883534B|nr:AAA family ATPase [Campylobacter concisus]MBE9829431.1 AAA family ATPase [Campylobacter concisus]
MFSNFCGIKIQGKCFQSEVKLNFFEKEYHRFCLIYGKNGSGKSTISQAFDTVEQNNQSLIASQIIDKSGAAVDLTNEDQKKNIFVFNEEYVNSKVKIKNNGLDAIVLLGKAKDIDEKLEKAKRINEKLKGRQSKYQEDFQKYSDIQNTDNPEKYKYDIIKSLKDNFAEREKNILGNTNRNLQNKTIEFAKNIIDHFETDVSTDELKNNFDEKLKSYEDMQSDLNFSEDIKKLNFEEIKQLLLHQVEQKQLTSREEEIKQAIAEASHLVTKNIMESDKDICPYCFQKLTDEYKKEILSSLETIFNPDIQNHRRNLENKKQEIQNSLNSLKNLPDMDKLDKDLFDAIKIQINTCQTEITEKLNQKIQNPFVALNLDVNFDNLVNELNQNLDQIEQKRQVFMAQKDRANELKQELEELNKQIAYYEIKDDFKHYEEKLEVKKTLDSNREHNDKRLGCITSKISKLNAQNEQINIAQDKINEYLKYIFFKEGRLELSENQGQYVLKSNSNRVKAKDVSTGERNAIALSYFFTEIFKGENSEEFYTKPKFIVIDDPISSFDFENRVGMMSFLNYQIHKIMTGCNKSKMIILTHDLMSAFDMQKIIGSLPQIKINDKNEVIFIQRELKNQKLVDFGKKYSEYKTLLNEIYDYANNSISENVNIGNNMRKVLETFGTFNYQCGIEDIARDKTIVVNLSPEQQAYFENLMYRLVLHGESHAEDKTKTLDFFSCIGEDEKQKTAKDILSLLYLLNKAHLQKYLQKEQVEKIEQWVGNCRISNNRIN